MKLFTYLATASLFLVVSIANSPAKAASAVDLASEAKCRHLARDGVDIDNLAYWRNALTACEAYLQAEPSAIDARYFSLASRFNLQQFEPALAGFEELAAQGTHPPWITWRRHRLTVSGVSVISKSPWPG
ncbi:hypothetical protein [Rhizobium leguminosarum]|uniref:hypothetical protein n=1 Tax=Rhizobium leguminosarum TaxID=384 RepID=UPI0021BC2958|nr:hypothetical protein [Rhizobium leguminosarum]